MKRRAPRVQALLVAVAAAALTGDVVHHLDAATLVGPVAPTRSITVGVVLKNPNEAGEDAYLASLYDPSSANYQNFLDPDQFNQQFGVSPTTFQAAQTWLTGAGLQVTTIDGAFNYLLASGSAAQVASAFGTPLNTYTAGGRTFYANAVAPSVPASLPIATVLGLNDFNHFTTPHIAPASGSPTFTTASPAGRAVPQTGALTPQTLWSIYDQPATNLGNGQTMAIFGWGVTDGVVNDLRSFEQEFRLPQVPITVKSYGDTSTPPTSGDGATVEWELDTQASTGMAPNVTSETLYFGNHNSDADILAAFTAWANDKQGPKQASASFGECENIPVGEPVRGRSRRHRAQQRRRQSAEAVLRDGVGVHRRRQQHADPGAVVPAGRRADGVPRNSGRRRDLGRRRDGERDADHGRLRQRPAGRRHEPVVAALARDADADPGRRREEGPRLRQ